MRVELCPECGSAKLELTTEGDIIRKLGGETGSARCHHCGWSGPKSELLTSAVPGQQDLTQDQAHAIALQVAQQYFVSLSKNASQGIGLAMIEAGIIGAQDKANLTRLIRAATAGAFQATLNEVEKLQQEQDDQPAN